jgi:regulator of RNase E activity RraA
MKKSVSAVLGVSVVLALAGGNQVRAQSGAYSKEAVLAITASWKGERLADGRPKVPDDILERMRKVPIEMAWGIVKSQGFLHQFEGNWMVMRSEEPLVGRALTAQYMPARPDVRKATYAAARPEWRVRGDNTWPIEMLEKGDVYVADGFGKVVDGTLIGDTLGTAIFTKSGNGVVFDGGVRDWEGLHEIKGFNAYVRGWDPTGIQDMMLTGINRPIRIGRATCLPGDVVLAKRGGVIFIPADLAEQVVMKAERWMLRDRFGHQRLEEGKYAPGQLDREWTAEIKADYEQWLKDNISDLPVPKPVVERWLKDRSW